jgi:ELWxxDGT repeat protein
MRATGNSVVGEQLWKTDGTAAGTVQVRQINPSTAASLWDLTAYDDLLLFRADDGSNGRELWVSDGTEAGTVLVKDIDTSGSGEPKNLFAVQPSPDG